MATKTSTPQDTLNPADMLNTYNKESADIEPPPTNKKDSTPAPNNVANKVSTDPEVTPVESTTESTPVTPDTDRLTSLSALIDEWDPSARALRNTKGDGRAAPISLSVTEAHSNFINALAVSLTIKAGKPIPKSAALGFVLQNFIESVDHSPTDGANT